MGVVALRRLAMAGLVALGVFAGVLASPAQGQQQPDPEQPGAPAPEQLAPQPPAPEPPAPPGQSPEERAAAAEEKAAAEGEEVDVERPLELERIRGELERLRAQRAAVSARELELEVAQREALRKEEQSPVLSVRREVLELSLDKAIEMALSDNPDYLVERLRALAAAEQRQVQVGAFDPALAVEASYGEGRPPFFSNNPFSGFPVGLRVASNDGFTVSTSLSKRFMLGTQARVFWTEQRTRTENQFALNPSYTPALGIELTQPLLRGFGLDVNRAPILIAELQSLQADATYADVLMTAVVAIEETYWGLVRAEEDLRFQERSLSSAIKFLDDQRRRKEVGAAADLDVIIAQAGVAARREGVIAAESALEAARDALLRLVRPAPTSAAWDVFILPTDRPWMITEPDLDADRSVQVARERRPDLHRATLGIETARQALLLRENEALPQLDLFSSLREDGIGGQHHSAWGATASGRFYSWQVGVRVNLPLFLRTERARARGAQIDLDRAEVELRSADANLMLDVRRSIRDVRTSKATIEATRASRILSARQLKATRTQVEHGTAVPRDVLDDLAALAQAESAEVRAFINYRLSLSRFERTRGTLLDRWLDKLDPRVRRALERAPYDASHEELFGP